MIMHKIVRNVFLLNLVINADQWPLNWSMFVKIILSAWSIILIDGLLLFDYQEKYSFSSAWSEMMIDGSQVAALRVVDSA